MQPRLPEHVGTRQKRSDNRGCLYINAIMRGPRRGVRIIQCSDNRSSDNRGFTVFVHVQQVTFHRFKLWDLVVLCSGLV